MSRFRRSLARLLIAGAATFASGTPAVADGPSKILASAEVLVVAVILLAAALGYALWERRRAIERARAVVERDEFLNGGLEAAGAAAALVNTDGSLTPTANLAAMFGFDARRFPSIDEVVAAFDPADGEVLAKLIAALRETGAAFSRTLRLRTNLRFIRVVGRRRGASDVIGFHESTEMMLLLVDRERDGRRLRELIDALPMPVWSRNSDQRIEECNAAYVRAVEASNRDAVLAESKELAERAAAGQTRDLAKKVRSLGTPQSAQQHIVVGGARRLYEITEAPLSPQRTGGYALDITRIEEIKQTLSRQISAHHEVLERLAVAIITVGPEGNLRFSNGAFARLWRLSDTWLETNPSLADLLDQLRGQRMLPETGDFAALRREWLGWVTGLIQPRQELLHLPNGMVIWMVASPHPLGGLLFTFENVTDRYDLERSVHTLRSVHHDTIDNLFEGVAVFGGDGCLKLSNPALRRMWKLDEAFAESGPHIGTLLECCRELLPYGVDWPRFKARLVSRVTNRKLRQGRLVRPDGAAFTYAHVPLPDGGLLMSFRDTTDSVRAERALRERAEALEAADRVKAAFIANISYELRTPLNAIIGFAEILNNQYFGQLNQRQFEYTEGILAASQHLLTLINDILDLAIIAAGRMQLEIDTVPVRALIDGVVQITGDWARGQQLRIETDCAPDIGTIRADERRIKHVLFNLVSNAIKFTPAGGRIGISARRAGQEVAIAVDDTGIGIAEEDGARVFDSFVRGRDKSGRAAGAGLGLSLVRSLIELHGGRVELASTQGIGTRVTCWLPVNTSPAQAVSTKFPAKLQLPHRPPAQEHRAVA